MQLESTSTLVHTFFDKQNKKLQTDICYVNLFSHEKLLPRLIFSSLRKFLTSAFSDIKNLSLDV
jgi:hypothetical protein